MATKFSYIPNDVIAADGTDLGITAAITCAYTVKAGANVLFGNVLLGIFVNGAPLRQYRSFAITLQPGQQYSGTVLGYVDSNNDPSGTISAEAWFVDPNNGDAVLMGPEASGTLGSMSPAA